MNNAFDDHILGTTTASVPLDSPESLMAAATALVGQARQSVSVMSTDLDRRAFGTDFVEACERLVLNHRRARVRVLVMDAAGIVARDHPMVQAARRLSSFMEIRSLAPEDATLETEVLLVDRSGLWLRTPHRVEGSVCFHAPREVRGRLSDFDNRWARGTADRDLRRLHL